MITCAVLLLVFPTGALAQSIVGILGIAGEVAPVERRLQDSREVVVRGYVFRVGMLDGRQVVVGRSGCHCYRNGRRSRRPSVPPVRGRCRRRQPVRS